MSRIIVKQLPKNITEEKIRNLFGAKGILTDVQLKYTPDGKFRQFCFIGYQNEEEAKTAVSYFNNSCIQTNRIKVELCSTLGSEDKPRSWSKYAKDSKPKSVGKRKEIENDDENKKKTGRKPSKLDEIFGKHKEDPDFQEFIKAHDKTRVLWANDAEANAEKELGIEENRATVKDPTEEVVDDKNYHSEEDSAECDEPKLAEKSISDLDYMKSLISNSDNKKSKSEKGKGNNFDLYTIKMHNVPYKVKRQEILKFFKPLKPYSVRLPTKVRGFCYVGFRSEKDMAKAMLKNKSFIKGKQVFFSDFTEKNKITKAKLEGSGGGTSIKEELRNSKWRQQEDSVRNEEDISESGKIFFRNLSYTVSEDDLQKVFEPFGPIADIHLPIDLVTRQIKGFGTVTYVMPEHAVLAYNKLDGSVFHGRLLHLIPGRSKDTDDGVDDADDSSLSFKQKKAMQLKKASANAATWNSLFLGPNAIAEILAKQFEMSKDKILDTNKGGSSAAVRIALGETRIVIEMKKFLEEHGVCLNAFEAPTKAKRSKTVILAKNLPADTSVAQLTPIFGKFGPIGRVVLPPSGVTALIEFCDASEARQAFKKLAYSKFKNAPLYLEWAPENTFRTEPNGEVPKDANTSDEMKKHNEKEAPQEEMLKEKEKKESEKSVEIDETELLQTEIFLNDDSVDDEEPEPNTTLFLRNLNLKTVQDTVCNHFRHLGAIHTVEIAKKKDPKNPGSTVSLGCGFIQFKKQVTAEKALKQMQLTDIDGNKVELKRSDRVLKSNSNATKRKTVNITKQTGSKIMVRNIPFQATANEVRDLFKAFGLLRSLRLPLKMTPGEATHRGFGFVDFMSKSDAKKAFEALSQSTHLYGRRLVLEWAAITDEDVAEMRKRTAHEFSATRETKRGKKALFSMDTDADDAANGGSGLIAEDEDE